jgi:hypothetical protein
LSVVFVLAYVNDAARLLVRELKKQKKVRTGWILRVAERKSARDGLARGVELSPEGPCGLGPIHLPQVSGFAGGC